MAAEQKLEQRIRKLCLDNAVLCFKFVSPGSDGVPDRILVFPNGVTAFVEVKAPGEAPRPLQRHRIHQLRKNKAVAEYFDSFEHFEAWFEAYLKLP